MIDPVKNTSVEKTKSFKTNERQQRKNHKKVEQRSRWKEHFNEILNREPLVERLDIPGPDGMLLKALQADSITITYM